jgi:hypothetical protein
VTETSHNHNIEDRRQFHYGKQIASIEGPIGRGQ